MNQCIFDLYSIQIMEKMRILIVYCLLPLTMLWGQETPRNESNKIQNNALEQNAAPVTIEIEEKESVDSKSETSAYKKSKAISTQEYQYRVENAASQSNYMRTQRTPTIQQQSQMDAAVANLEKIDSKSFEYNYFKYVSGNHDVSRISFLEKAEKIRPNNSDVQVQLAAYYIILKNDKSALKYLNNLANSGRLSEESIDYSYDLLMSVPDEGVLITHGFDDTYGANLKQLQDKIRKDVTIVSLDLLQSDAYRKRLQQQGFKLPAGKVINVTYFQEFCKLNYSKNIAVSMTLPKEYLQGIKSNLYVVGLIMEYHKSADLNMYKNDLLWSEKLDKKLIDHAVTLKGKELSANYLPMLLLLRQYYESTNEKSKLKEVNEALDKVAVQCNKYDKVQQLKGSY